jgi:putative CocE/NonD family hydrolase
VPTTGGPIIGEGGGVRDQRPFEDRAGVLVYVSHPLPADIEVTGRVTLELWAATSAVELVDVRPDGFAQNITEGIVRARFRESLSDPTPVEPDRPYRFNIDMAATSHVFAAGHRIGLDVTSSNFPRFDRNAGTGLPFGEDRKLEPATQTSFDDGGRPSALLLPTID